MDHNSHVSYWTFTILPPMETGMNAQRRGYNTYNFTPKRVSTQLVETKTT